MRAASEYVRSLDANHRGLASFVEFHAELGEWRGASEPDEVFSGLDPDPSARFCFDNSDKATAVREFDRLVDELYSATLESWRQNIDAGIDTPPGHLVDFFTEPERCAVGGRRVSGTVTSHDSHNAAVGNGLARSPSGLMWI